MALRLASGSYDNTIKFWDPSTGTSIANETINLGKYNLVPNRIEISEDKSKIIVGMYNSTKIYDLGKCDTIIKSYDNYFKGNVSAVGFAKEGKMIYTACQDGYLRLFDLKIKQQPIIIKQNKPITCAVMHPTQNFIVAGDQGGYCKTWEIKKYDKQFNTILSQDQVAIRSLAISNKGNNIIFGDSNGLLQPFYMYEKSQNTKKMDPIRAHNDYILKVQMSANNKYLATCSADKKIKLFKITQNQKSQLVYTQLKVLKGHLKWVWDCHFSCDSAYLISCSTDGTIKLWDVQKGQLVQTLKGHDKGVICLALNDIAESS